mgnify:CR=1 FL=1
MRLCVLKAVVFEEGADQLRLPLQYFVQHLLVVDVVTSLIAILHGSTGQLLLVDRFDLLNLIESLERSCPEIVQDILLTIFIFVVFVQSVLSIVKIGT